MRHFYPIFKNTEFWKKSVYRLIFGIPTTLAALLPRHPAPLHGIAALCPEAGRPALATTGEMVPQLGSLPATLAVGPHAGLLLPGSTLAEAEESGEEE